MLPVDHPDRKAVGGCGGGWWWHTPADTIDKADREVLADDTRLYITMTLRMCMPELHPYDFVPVANDFIGRMTEYQDAAKGRFDLADALAYAQAFREAALDLRAHVAGHGARDVNAINALHLSLSRLVNPVLFTIAGPYEFDPALQLPVLPGLARAAELPDSEGNDAGFLRTELVRQKNRVVDTLHTATQMIRKAVATR
jgi:hypothetical protein